MLEAAFGQAAEADLAARLLLHPDTLEVVAVAEGELAGCIVFSRVTTARDPAATLAGLGPLGIAPSWQGRGVGTLLIGKGLAACSARGIGAVVVLGHPDFYRRFGFAPAQARGICCKWVVPEDAFMVKELVPGALADVRGRVDYLPEFDAI